MSNLLNERISEVPLSSTKGTKGHCLGAAGSVECAICIMAINKDMIPPTLRFDEEKYPLKGINYVSNRAISQEVNVFISNSFAFGGNNYGFDTSFFTCKSIIACKELDYKRLVLLKFLRRTDEITKLTITSGKQILDSVRITISR